MFRRREQLTRFERLKAAVWPRRGWRRSTLYIVHRLGRLPGTPYRVAAGFACGAAVSFTPFVGFHFLLAALLSLILRGNILASAIGTVVGNPWTFPFIWTWTYGLGRWLLGESPHHQLSDELTLQYIFENTWSVLWPMTVGALPTGTGVWVVAYLVLYSIVHEYQRARQWRIRKKASRAQKQSEEAGLSEGQLGKQA